MMFVNFDGYNYSKFTHHTHTHTNNNYMVLIITNLDIHKGWVAVILIHLSMILIKKIMTYHTNYVILWGKKVKRNV